MVEQAKDIWAIFEQVRNHKQAIILIDKDKLPLKISVAGDEVDHKKGKRLGGFLVGSNDTSAPKNFDRMSENEIFALFAGEYDEHFG